MTNTNVCNKLGIETPTGSVTASAVTAALTRRQTDDITYVISDIKHIQTNILFYYSIYHITIFTIVTH